MPDLNAHRQQIANNTNFFKDINKNFDGKYFDWKITTLFYTILHCIEALGAKGGRHLKKHIDRESFVSVTLEREEIAHYRLLYNASRRSRYDACYLTRDARDYCIELYRDTYLPLKKAFDEKYLK